MCDILTELDISTKSKDEIKKIAQERISWLNTVDPFWFVPKISELERDLSIYKRRPPTS